MVVRPVAGRTRAALIALIATLALADLAVGVRALTSGGLVAEPSAAVLSKLDPTKGVTPTTPAESTPPPVDDTIPEIAAATVDAPPAPAPAVTPVDDHYLIDPGVPEGKGMWIWLPEYVNGGDVHSIVQQATGMGLTHLYVRTGSSRKGLDGLPFVDALLPVAHDAGLRVYGWDFPELRDQVLDVHRSWLAISHEAPGGHRLDGFVADIETQSEGTALSTEGVRFYGERLRSILGEDYPLMIAVPRPSTRMIGTYPYAEAAEHFSALLPMVYWLNRQPDTDVHGAIAYLAQFGKPILPIGQAYDGAPEGGRPGPPPAHEIERFINTAASLQARSVSFWSWQHASNDIWWTIARSPHFRPPQR